MTTTVIRNAACEPHVQGLCRLLIAMGAILGVLCIAGCPSMSTIGSARTMDAGSTQFFVAPAYSSFSMGGEPLRQPQLELGGRYGITDNVELGAKLWLPGLELESKFAACTLHYSQIELLESALHNFYMFRTVEHEHLIHVIQSMKHVLAKKGHVKTNKISRITTHP